MNAARYARTVRHLTAAQVAHRVRLRAQRALFARWPAVGERLLAGWPAGPGAGWPAGFVPFDGRVAALWPPAADLAAGRFALLGQERRVGTPATGTDWAQPGAPLLWRYHLHYWDWAWALRDDPDLPALHRSWLAATAFGQGEAWAPYVVSLRAWTFCALSGRLGVEPAELARHQAFLRTHLERDLGGNHLLKNLKALVGLAVFAADRAGVQRWTAALLVEIRAQVLPDGGHYERSPAYHCQVLADLSDVADLLAAAGWPVPPALPAAVDGMRRWLAAVLLPDGSVPPLNDGYGVPPAAVADLLGPALPPAAVADLPGPALPPASLPRAAPAGAAPRSTYLADTGLAVLRSGRLHLLADVGPPGPRHLLGHAHADSLGFVLYVDGRAVVVDPGTSTYEDGPRRAYERSTAAHATVTVDGADSTEVWGAFRAGRRATTTVTEVAVAGDPLRLTAEHDGYAWLPGAPVHRRSWSLAGDRLMIEDTVTGTGRHRVDLVLPLAPGLLAEGIGGRLKVHTGAAALTAVVTGAAGEWHVRPDEVAVGWGRTEPAVVATFQVDAVLPLRLRTELGPAYDLPAAERHRSTTLSA